MMKARLANIFFHQQGAHRIATPFGPLSQGVAVTPEIEAALKRFIRRWAWAASAFLALQAGMAIQAALSGFSFGVAATVLVFGYAAFAVAYADGAGRLTRTLPLPPAPIAVAAPAAPATAVAPALPAAAITEAQVADCLDHLDLPFGDTNPAILAYHRVFVTRYANTLNTIARAAPGRNLRVLELAANPYGMTALLRHLLFDRVTLASFGDKSAPPKRIELSVHGQPYGFDEYGFNAESDDWPFPDGAFDLVISCEMLEHMAMDPMAIFAGANRILRPGGMLLISTPNASSLQNIVKLIRMDTPGLAPHFRRPACFENIYLRHSREYTPQGLAELFAAGGFQVDAMATDDSYPFSGYGLSDAEIAAVRATAGEPGLRGDTLNFIGRKVSAVLDRYPTAQQLYHPADG